MAVPPYDQFIEPVLRCLAANPPGMAVRDVYDRVAKGLALTAADRLEVETDSSDYVYRKRAIWAQLKLERAGLATSSGRGSWQLTEAGVKFAREQPSPLSVSVIEELLTDNYEPHYREWAKLLGVVSPTGDPLDALVAHYLEASRKNFAPLLARVPDERDLVRQAIAHWAVHYAEPGAMDLEKLAREVGWHLFGEQLLLGFLDSQRARRVRVVDGLHTAVARGRDGVTPDGDRAAVVELELRLRAAESNLENWDTLGRDDFQLDPAGEFLEGRTVRGRAALKDPGGRYE